MFCLEEGSSAEEILTLNHWNWLPIMLLVQVATMLRGPCSWTRRSVGGGRSVTGVKLLNYRFVELQ